MELADALKVIRLGLDEGSLVVVVGSCKVMYEGRAASKLSEGDRLLMIKKDGTFLVHQSTKMSAINYQGPGTKVSVELGFDPNDQTNRTPVELVATAFRTLPNNSKESIEVRFHTVLSAAAHPLVDDSKLKLFGTEQELSCLLMQDLNLIEKGLVPRPPTAGK